MKILQKTIGYALKRQRNIIYIGIGVITAVFIIVVYSNWSSLGLGWWSNWVDPMAGVATFLVALGVWLSKQFNAWEDDLPKRLTVIFIYQKRMVMKCEEAYLASEGDIRAWGQQIGSQMSGKSRLDIQPYIKQEAPIRKVDEEGKDYRLYVAYFYLNQMPEPSKDLAVGVQAEIRERLATGGIVWTVEEFER